MPSPFEGLIQPPASTFQIYQSGVNQAENQQQNALAQQAMQQRQQALNDQILQRKTETGLQKAQFKLGVLQSASAAKDPAIAHAILVAADQDNPWDMRFLSMEPAVQSAVSMNQEELQRQRQLQADTLKMHMVSGGHWQQYNAPAEQSIMPPPSGEFSARLGGMGEPAQVTAPPPAPNLPEAMPPPQGVTSIAGQQFVPTTRPGEERNLGDYSIAQALVRDQGMTWDQATRWIDDRRRQQYRFEIKSDALGRTKAFVIDNVGRTVDEVDITPKPSSANASKSSDPLGIR